MIITPAALKAAWIEARRWWPRKVVEVQAGQKVAEAHYFRVVETAIPVDEPAPGFREAIEAALRAQGFSETDHSSKVRPS